MTALFLMSRHQKQASAVFWPLSFLPKRQRDLAEGAPRTVGTGGPPVRLLDLLPKVISERPSLREPSARRDEGVKAGLIGFRRRKPHPAWTERSEVNEHPQPKNNAAIGFRRPELEATSREAGSSSNSQSFSFRKGLLANGLSAGWRQGLPMQ